MAPKFNPNSIQIVHQPIVNRWDFYVMGAVLVIALAIASQILNTDAKSMAAGKDDSYREVQSSPEIGN